MGLMQFPYKNHFILNAPSRCTAFSFRCEFSIMSPGKPLRLSLASTRIHMIKCLFKTLSSGSIIRRLVFVLLPFLKCFSISSLTSISFQRVKRHWKWLLFQGISKEVLGLILSKHLALFSIFWPGCLWGICKIDIILSFWWRLYLWNKLENWANYPHSWS